MGLRAFVPPPERRGLVLVDPPYEEEAEWEKAAEAVVHAWRKWTAGIYALCIRSKTKGQRKRSRGTSGARALRGRFASSFKSAPLCPRGRLRDAASSSSTLPFSSMSRQRFSCPGFQAILAKARRAFRSLGLAALESACKSAGQRQRLDPHPGAGKIGLRQNRCQARRSFH